METNEKPIEKTEGVCWSIDREIETMTAALAQCGTDKEGIAARTAILDALKKAEEIRDSHVKTDAQQAQASMTQSESIVRIIKDVGTLVLFVGMVVFAYHIDKSDAIPRNKMTMNLVNKFFHL